MIQIIDYGAGNLRSVQNALKKLGIESKVINSGEDLKTDCKTIFPGVGAAGSAMKEIEKRGFIDPIKSSAAPLLGICLGMQLLLDFSEENSTQGLGIINGKVKKFPTTVKIPQIGWNKVEQTDSQNPLFDSIPSQSYFYFVNSYFATPESYSIGTTNYDLNFTSVINKDNFYGVQFHPEKSGEIGLQLLNNFCKKC